MTDIAIECEPAGSGWACEVRIAEGGRTTSHHVTVTRDDLDRLAPGADAPEDLVRRSFEFLLAREPATSILRRFELPVIGRYFAEYEREIVGRRDDG